jgi:hypothetical protein
MELTKEEYRELLFILGYAAAKAGKENNPELIDRVERMAKLVSNLGVVRMGWVRRGGVWFGFLV